MQRPLFERDTGGGCTASDGPKFTRLIDFLKSVKPYLPAFPVLPRGPPKGPAEAAGDGLFRAPGTPILNP